MAAEVKIRGRLSNGVADIKSLMPHPMETGTQRDPQGNLIPAHYIEKVVCFRNDQEVLSADWGASVSKDPYFAFQGKNCSPGAFEMTKPTGSRTVPVGVTRAP